MDKKFIKTDDERNFFNKIEGMSEKELLELNAYYLSDIRKKINKIDNNIRFFFYVTVISLVIGAIIMNQLN